VHLIKDRGMAYVQASQDLKLTVRNCALETHDLASCSAFIWPWPGKTCCGDRRTSSPNRGTRNEAKADVFDYIERFYKSKRGHWTVI
jgi:hypothetical protein